MKPERIIERELTQDDLWLRFVINAFDSDNRTVYLKHTGTELTEMTECLLPKVSDIQEKGIQI